MDTMDMATTGITVMAAAIGAMAGAVEVTAVGTAVAGITAGVPAINIIIGLIRHPAGRAPEQQVSTAVALECAAVVGVAVAQCALRRRAAAVFEAVDLAGAAECVAAEEAVGFMEVVAADAVVDRVFGKPVPLNLPLEFRRA